MGDKKVTDIELVDYAKKALLIYGKYVIEQRALPDYRDGEKPVHRRILWAAYKLGLTAKSKPIKTARIIGECFVAGTLVSTPTGHVPIENLKIGDTVLTSLGEQKVVQTYYWPSSPIVEVQTDSTSVQSTLGQEFKVQIGDKFFWKKAEELQPGDLIVSEA